MMIGFLKKDKSCHVCSMRLKGVLAKYEKYGSVYAFLYLNVYYVVLLSVGTKSTRQTDGWLL